MTDEAVAAGRAGPPDAAVLPGLSTALKAAVVAALFFLYLIGYTVFGDGHLFDYRTYYWHEALVELAILAALLWASRVTPRPYSVFLRILAVSIVFLIGSAVGYQQGTWLVGPQGSEVCAWELFYALFLFTWVCAWGYLTVELWQLRRPSVISGVVFMVLMGGLGGFYVSFYGSQGSFATEGTGGDRQEQTLPGPEDGPPAAVEPAAGAAPAGPPEAGGPSEVTAESDSPAGGAAAEEVGLEAASPGRETPPAEAAAGADACEECVVVDTRMKKVHATLELSAVMVGLATVLLGVPGSLVAMVFGATMLAAINMAYILAEEDLEGVEPFWMAALCVLLAASLAIHRGDIPEDSATRPALARSGLSGLLLLLSLGAVLLVVSADESIEPDKMLKPFLLAFVVLLVIAMVWVTDRFDRAVLYLRSYADGLVADKLRGGNWREEPTTIQGILRSTGLGAYLDHLRDRFDAIRDELIFLGPERLHRPPDLDSDHDARLRCFLVMPFSEEWSDRVHQIIRESCRAKRVTPIRGDDLFSPTDIVEDIWQSLHAADFVLADITGRNPNVLYELGIAHTIAKPVLIISQRADDIPIDLATRRVLVYDRSSEEWEDQLRAKLTHAIGEILQQYDLKPPPSEYRIWPTVIMEGDEQKPEKPETAANWRTFDPKQAGRTKSEQAAERPQTREKAP